MSTNAAKAQIAYFSHGGGPLPLLGDPGHQAMVTFMQQLPALLTRPAAILVISAHWEENRATVLSAPNPPLFYDYYGFPKQAYAITYPAPGNPPLAGQLMSLLEKSHIPAGIDPDRGFDHGVFIPLKLMYPEADIPVLQLSLIRGLDAAQHLALGRALQSLKNENILVIGSGFSFHNMNAFFGTPPGMPDPKNEAFQEWLIETCTGPLDQATREDRLLAWEQAPYARYCHPREEHLLPLLVCSAMAGAPGKIVFDDQILGKRSIAVLWR